jgi:Domain of unknown function (DUF4833)
MTLRRISRFCAVLGLLTILGTHSQPAWARTLTTSVEELARIPKLQEKYPVPQEPNMLFYIQRSVNANTVIYVAPPEHRDTSSPVDVFWRLYNIDGHTRPLNFIERLLAYGVNSVVVRSAPAATSFRIAAIPELELLLQRDTSGHPEAVMQFEHRSVRLVYVYLQVDDHGMMPRVTALDLFGVEQGTGKALHEHVIPH